MIVEMLLRPVFLDKAPEVLDSFEGLPCVQGSLRTSPGAGQKLNKIPMNWPSPFHLPEETDHVVYAAYRHAGC